ncbi:MAG TPA: GNAT family N-acetyltransferase [Blastocatellia bacterium]|nr:GNAT family N-acetyltransferase [Blastocatellia bacterium]
MKIDLLTQGQENEALDFLSARPLHSVFLSGFIRDNGLVSEQNRGSFYACRDKEGRLEGIALMGHAVLIEARSDAALRAFARLARGSESSQMLLGEQEKVERFWSHYAEAGQVPQSSRRMLLLEKHWPIADSEAVGGLRFATLSDIDNILAVNAQMAVEESGHNPMEVDPSGFRSRAARRIEQNRVWVWTEGDRLVFKTEVVTETPDCVYIEGVYVNPEARRKGYGTRCFSQLSRSLLARADSICLLVNEQNYKARRFYESAGYEHRGFYDCLSLGEKN